LEIVMADRLEPFLNELRQWVEIETPTHEKQQVDRLGGIIREACEEAGLVTDIVPGAPGLGDTIRARSGPDNGEKPVLVLAHFDTVHPLGTLEKHLPWRRDGDRLYGPGIGDMKACGLMALQAWRDLKAAGRATAAPVTFLFTPDEEIGSPGSREIIEEEGRKACATLVVEAARDGGKIVVSRKGVARYVVRTHGVASHAGSKFEEGRNAISEMARQIAVLEELIDLKEGITLNVGMIAGGTSPNTVAAECAIEVDIRIPRMDQVERVLKAVEALEPLREGLRVEVEGGLNRPPMYPDAGADALFAHARALAKPIGIDLVGLHAGGGSDGNFTAALGTPTLDGLGVEGVGAHTLEEHILVSSVLPRIDLFAELLATTSAERLRGLANAA
jgi:glutamate carboxypeptidase